MERHMGENGGVAEGVAAQPKRCEGVGIQQVAHRSGSGAMGVPLGGELRFKEGAIIETLPRGFLIRLHPWFKATPRFAGYFLFEYPEIALGSTKRKF